MPRQAGQSSLGGLAIGVARDLSVAEYWIATAALAAQHGTHPRQQLRHLEGLVHIVIGPAVQTAQSVIEVVAGGDDQQGCLIALGADALQYVHAVLAFIHGVVLPLHELTIVQWVALAAR